jgi:hypothetical protein
VEKNKYDEQYKAASTLTSKSSLTVANFSRKRGTGNPSHDDKMHYKCEKGQNLIPAS